MGNFLIVLTYMYIPVNLDNELLTDNSAIDIKLKPVIFDDSLTDNHSIACVNRKYYKLMWTLLLLMSL